MASIEDALKYLKMGFSVIPVKPHDKVAAVSWGEYQKRLPTEQEVKQWFNGGDNNIAIVCGKVSGNLVVFDFDDINTVPFVMGSIGEVAKKTMVVRTGKGYHVYYKTKEPQNFKLNNIKVDVKGEGGYVLAPPSIHPSGVRYEVVGTDKISEAKPELTYRLREADHSIALARVVEPLWGSDSTHRHELSLGLASFFKVRAKWPQEATERFILGIMRMKNDTEEEGDRLRAVADAYKKEYPYNKHLPSDVVEKLVRLLPVGTGEIWRWYDKGKKDDATYRAYMCNSEGVFRIYHKEWDEVDDNNKHQHHSNEDIETIFTQPLTLVDAWHAEGDDENQIRFTFYLGKMKYQGTKVEVGNQIIESGLSGINRNFIKDSIAACVEYYASSGLVSVRQSYEAIGVYESDGRFEIALGEKDISATRGTEPWYVFRNYVPWKGDVKDELKIFSELTEFFDPHLLAVFSGLTALSPFSYALKSNGNFFWPLIILKGPPATGKTTLAQLFTSILYGLQDGGPADVTSDFRLLDFITGTTFPRLVDESENAKFEGQKFSIKISTTLKDAAQKQFVGVRGDKDRTKKLYAARTPLLLVGNKIEMEDPALLTRSIIFSTEQSDKVPTSQRKRMNEEVLKKIKRGWGIELVKFIMSRYPSVPLMIDEIRKNDFGFEFRDPRRADFYAAVYMGLKMWTEFYESYEMKFPLSGYLNPDEFEKVIKRWETANMEESQERQSIQEFIEWGKKEYGILNDMIQDHKPGDRYPDKYYSLKQMIDIEIENEKQWLIMTQPFLTEYCKINPSFQARSLTEVADYLAEFFNTDKVTFYDRTKGKRVGGKLSKVLRIPLNTMNITDYGSTGKGKGGPPPDNGGVTSRYQGVTSAGNTSPTSVEANGNESVTMLPENPFAREEVLEKCPIQNIENVGNMVTDDSKNKDSTLKIGVTKGVTSRYQWYQSNAEYLNSINEIKFFLSEFELHGRVNSDEGTVYIDVATNSDVSHWIIRRASDLGFSPIEGKNENQLVLKYKEVSQ